MRLTKAQVVHLRSMEQDGYLTPEAVVSDARKQGSPLHPLFEWDRNRAAQAHWLEQARSIIRSVKIEITIETFEIAAVRYVPDPVPPPGRYRDIEAMSDGELRLVVAQEADRAVGHMKRAAALAATAGLGDELERLVGAWSGWRDALSVEQPIPLRTAAD